MNNRIALGSLALALLMLSGSVFADGYIGAAFGKVSHDIDSFEEPNSFEFYAGINLNENVAIEGSYLKPDDASDNIPPEWTISIDGFTIGAVGKLKVAPQLELQAKAGLFFWDFEASEDGFGTFYENDGSDVFFGFGGMLKASEQIGLGVRYSFYEADDEDFDILQAQIQIAFQ